MTDRLTKKEIKRRLEAGETACSISIEIYEKHLALVAEHKFETHQLLYEYLRDNKQFDECPLCVKYRRSCNDCPLPKVDVGSYCIEDDNSVFNKYWESKSYDELEVNIERLIAKLKETDIVEKEK